MKIEPGILAFVINSTCGNDGKLVQVNQLLGLDASYEGKKWNRGRISWLVTSLGGPLTTSKGHEYMTMPIAQDQLKPIEPLNDADDVDTEVPVTNEPESKDD